MAMTANQQPVAVVTPHSQSHQLRARLLAHGISLLGVKFLSPEQMRKLLLRELGLRVPLREHLRLLLGVAAEEVERLRPDSMIAKSVARDPDHFLRAIDLLGAAGGGFERFKPTALREIAGRFERHVQKCGFVFVHEADRAAEKHAAASSPLFSNLLLVGFDAAHWPLWPLLRASAQSAPPQNRTVILREPRDDAAELDRSWITTWEEHFGVAQHVPGSDANSQRRFHFIMGRDSGEQARAVVTLAIAFLTEPTCDRLAILLPGPGALARLVASWLERFQIPHNDGIAHQMRGVFDDEEWRAWLELQERQQLGPLIRFLNHSPVAIGFFAPLPPGRIKDTLQRACGDILISAVDVLREYCSRRTDEPKYCSVAEGLSKLRFLPERATFGKFLDEAYSIFAALKWTQRSAELERLSRDWSRSFAADFSRQHFLRWLSDTFAESSLSRDAWGDQPYARVQLLRYDDAEGEPWSHIICAGLNQGIWPPQDDESPFMADDEIDALNQRNRQQSQFGKGQDSVEEGTTLCLGSRERRALALRRLLNVIESTTQGIGVSAELYSEFPREQGSNPSEFFARLFFTARDESLSQRQIARLHDQTHKWLTQQELFVPDDAKTDTVKQTAKAYNARRTNERFGEYEFAFPADSPPAEQISLSATDIANSLRRPALVWMKTFLDVQAEELNGGSWNLATGQWVHRWLALIGSDPHDKLFVPRLAADQILRRVTAAADTFKLYMSSILQACGRNRQPDWWISGWRNARHLAEGFAAKLTPTQDWPRLATEWALDRPHIIYIDNGEELRVRGRVDLILERDKPSNERWIIDYKTGAAKPLKATPAQMRRQLVVGDGIQICVYALALRDAQHQISVSLLTRDAGLGEGIPLDDIVQQGEIWNEIARMHKTGIFGMLGELHSEFSFTGTYPLATLAIDQDLLKTKWARTHAAFA